MKAVIQAGLSTGPVKVTQDHIKEIMNLPNPPLREIKPEDVYVRRCFLTGDGLNSYRGRFRTKDLGLLLELTRGAPLMVAHNTGNLPVGRFLSGEIVERETDVTQTGNREKARFVAPEFYWMKAYSGAEDLRINIDGGIYSHASISWTYKKPECCICGMDLRRCPHIPGEEYDGKQCWYWYDGIQEVLEGSIVYKGGHPGTGFTLEYGKLVSGLEISEKLFNKTCRKVIRNGRETDIPVTFSG